MREVCRVCLRELLWLTGVYSYVKFKQMAKSLNSSQAKLLADFCSDLAKGLILAAISLPITAGKSLPYGGLLVLIYSIAAVIFLRIALVLLKGVKSV